MDTCDEDIKMLLHQLPPKILRREIDWLKRLGKLYATYPAQKGERS